MKLSRRTLVRWFLGTLSALAWIGCTPQGLWAGQAETRKVVIVTGIDYPGHKWQETAPVLAEAIRKDPRLKVDVVETPAFLATPKLNDYDVVVLHFMNWESPDPGEQARQNLAHFVSNGGGMVLVHFACGAFQGWPEFVKIAGRVYDPKLRPHDPYGSFQVIRTNVDHPITQGMRPFETTDELYTCLAPSNTPIEIIATAKSKVDGIDYPMGFVLNYGKGRVFHSVLGHDAQAIANPPVAELFRRASAWCANLPVPVGAGFKPAHDSTAKKIAFLAGKRSHGEDIHGWEADAEFVKQCLLHATNIQPLQIDVHNDGWPKDPAALDNVDAIIFFADGRDLHPLKEPARAAKIRELAKQGKGLAFLHYSIDPPTGLEQDMQRWMGGCYQVGLSQNPVNTVKVTPVENGHPISRGCRGYVAEDEWYFDIGFRPNDPNVVPIMTGKLPPRSPQDKVLAWAYTRADGGRGFGFTGGHPDKNWHMEPFRKLVLNAILWVAKAEVPEGGVASVQPWRFVSIPNFAGAEGQEETLDYVLKAIKAENPEFVLVPGDLVAGNWPDKDSIEKQAAVYYPAWVKRTQDHGLAFYAAVGDHDIGGSPWPAEKADLVRLFKRQFQKHLAMPLSGPLRMKGTAFWFVHENALFVALDVFEKGTGAQTGIVPQVTAEQLQWLEQTLADNPGVAHVIVMAHTPVIQASSAGLTLAGGTESPLWQTLKKHRAALYLCGEVPAIQCTQADGILQIAHGATIGRDPKLNYLVATVSNKGIELELKEIAVKNESGRVAVPEEARKQGFVSAGKARLDGGTVMKDATGCFPSTKEAKP